MLWMGIWVPPYTVTHVQLGVHDDSWICGYVWSLCNDVRSCLRLYTSNTDGFPHSYHNSHKCFCLLLCSGWGYGSSLTLLWFFAGWTVPFQEVWGMLEAEWYCTVLAEAPNKHRLHPTASTSYVKVQSVLVPCYAVDCHMGPALGIPHESWVWVCG